jgi:hypothetical protein
MNATHWVALGVGVGIGVFLVGIAVLAFWMGKR